MIIDSHLQNAFHELCSPVEWIRTQEIFG